LQALPQAVVASIDEVMLFIDSAKLYSIGVGYIDVHLLASAKLTPGVLIWTRDRRLREASERLHLDAKLG
jgi:hypothetical protein